MAIVDALEKSKLSRLEGNLCDRPITLQGRKFPFHADEAQSGNIR